VAFFTYGTGGEFLLDGVKFRIKASSGWEETQIEAGSGPHTLRWVKTGRYDWAVDEFRVTPLAGASVADALDFPGPWILDPTNSWTISTTDTHDGEDAVLINDSGVLSHYVNGPGRLQFHRKANWNYGPADTDLMVQTDAAAWYGGRSPQWAAHTIDTIPPGRQLLRFRAGSTHAGTFGFDAVNFTPYAETPLAAALEGSGLTITTNPAAPWRGWLSGTAAHDGSDAAISPEAGDGWLELTLPAAGVLSFFARCPGSDGIRLNVSPQIQDGYILPREWKEFVYPLTGPGPHTVRIQKYQGAAVWLDHVTFVSAQAQFSAWLAQHGLPANADLQSDSDGDGQPLLVEYAFGLDPNARHARDASVPAEITAPEFKLVEGGWGVGPIRQLECQFHFRGPGSGLWCQVFFSSDPAAPLDAPAAVSFYPGDNPPPDGWLRGSSADLWSWPSASRRFGRLKVIFEP